MDSSMGQEAIHWCVTVCLAIPSPFLVACHWEAEETQLIEYYQNGNILKFMTSGRPTSKQNYYTCHLGLL